MTLLTTPSHVSQPTPPLVRHAQVADKMEILHEAPQPHVRDVNGAPLPPQVVYDAFRRQIEHEDNLISQRATWLLVAQSFLVVAYSILHQLAPPTKDTQPVTGLLVHLIAGIGLLTTLPTFVSVWSASVVMRNLRSRFHALCRVHPEYESVFAPLPAIQPTGITLVLGRAPSVVLPLLFFLFWSALLIATATMS